MGRGTWYYSLGVFLAIVDAFVRSEFEISSWRGARVGVRTYLLGGAIDGSEANGIIRDPKLELESSRFTFDLVPLSYESVDVVVGENWLLRHKAEMVCHEKVVKSVPKELVGFTPRRRMGFRMELVQGATPICEGSCRLTSLERQEVWNDCRSYKVRVGSNGNLLWEASVLLGRKKDDRGVTEGREDVREVFQQRGSGAKRKLSRCGRNQMGNEPILALPKGADDFIVYYDARSKDLKACLEKRRRLTNRWLSMKTDIASCGSKYLAYSEVEVEYQGSSGLLLQPETSMVDFRGNWNTHFREMSFSLRWGLSFEYGCASFEACIVKWYWESEGNLPVARLTSDDTEARYDWWVSSRAYFDGIIDQAERGMNVGPVREANKGPIIVSQHYGISDFSEFQSNQGGRSSFQTQANNSFLNMGTPTNWQTPMPSQPGSSNWQSQMAAQPATPFRQPAISSHPGTYNWQSQIPSHMGNPNSQTPIETHPDAAGLLDPNISNRGKREQRPNMYRRTPYVEQPPTIVLPKQRGNKTKNKVHKATALPLNLGNVFYDDNEGSDDIMFVGGQFTGNMLVYENVDPNKHINSWMELLIRSRPENASWTVAKTGTMSLNNPTSQIVESSHVG
ncbi:hypothetical protein Tco_0973285 [Tanacetum coccineum]